MIYHVEVMTKDTFKDTHGEALRHSIADIGTKKVPKIKSLQLYQLDGDLNLRELNTIAKNLLLDPITQTCTIKITDEHTKNKRLLTRQSGYEVEIWYKDGVTDTVAESVGKAIKDLGIQKNLKLKTGLKYQFLGKGNSGYIRQIIEKLLVNPIIQKYVFNAL